MRGPVAANGAMALFGLRFRGVAVEEVGHGSPTIRRVSSHGPSSRRSAGAAGSFIGPLGEIGTA